MQAVPLGEVVTIERQIASNADVQNLPFVGLEDIEKDEGRLVGAQTLALTAPK